MGNFKICRLCYNSVSQDVEIISEVHTEILEVLLIKLDLSISDSPVVCHDCWEQLQKNLNFKSNCLEVEDPGEIIDLVANSNNKSICVLCVNFTEDKCTFSVDEKNVFYIFFPEVNWNINLATMCSACYESFQSYFIFATKCLDWEDKLQQYVKMVGLRKKRKFCLEYFLQNLDKLGDVEKENNKDVKHKENFHVVCNEDELNIKHEITEAEDSSRNDVQMDANSKKKDGNSDGKKRLKCSQCPYESIQKSYMRKHELMHQGIGIEYKKKTEKFNCSVCSFTTNSKHYLIKHELMHKGHDKKLQCPECPLKTVYKDCLLKHLRTVHNPDAEVFMCNDCEFSTKHKISIIRHVENHRHKEMLSCDSCNYKTLYPAKFELHVCKVKKIPRKYPCDMCSFVTTQLGLLRHHKWIFHDVGDYEFYKCHICSFFTKRKSTLRKHLRVHETKSKHSLYKCPLCEFKTFYAHCLKKHYSTHQSDEPLNAKQCIFESYAVEKKFKCKECDASFATKRGLQSHELIHSEERPFKCNLCPYRAKNVKNLSHHRLTHRDAIIRCPMCDYQTVTNTRLKLHMIKHADKPKLHKCKLCPFESKWKVSYRNHMKASHNGELFFCDKCDFKTAHRRTITTHQLVHDKDKLPTLKCSKCHFTTLRPDSMKTHNHLVHKDPSELTMFKCTECSFGTKYRRSLRNHIRDIHENKGENRTIPKAKEQIGNFKCSKCSFRAPLQSDLNQHVARKHSTTTYKCSKCPYSTHFSHNLRNHKTRMHTKSEILKCNSCEFETKYKRSLMNHISNIHEQWEVLEENGHKEIKRKK